MNKKRIQLTLFVPEDQSREIEKIRQEFNPGQYALIKSHVTLCREDELEEIEEIVRKLRGSNFKSVAIDFGNVIRFSNGAGVLLPATGNPVQFQKLREKILSGIFENPRMQEPHITLMHPRNSTCTDEIFRQIQHYGLPGKIEFGKISLIEQEMEMKWNILEEFELSIKP